MAAHSPVIPISRKRVRPLESHRGARCLCLPTSQPRPDRCTPIAGKRSTPPQSLSYWDRTTHRNGRVIQCRNATTGTLSVLFGLVLGITPRTSKNKNEFPAAHYTPAMQPQSHRSSFPHSTSHRILCGRAVSSIARTLPSTRTETISHCPHRRSTHNFPAERYVDVRNHQVHK